MENETYWKNVDQILYLVSKNWRDWESISLDLKNNFDIATDAISDHIKNNFDIAMDTLGAYGRALEHASNELKSNYHTVMAAVKQHSWAVEHDDLRHNFDIAMAAIKQNSNVLVYSTEKLKRQKV